MPSQPSLPAQRAELAQACRALWLATLSLMTAFMHTPAPAHRHLLARRIARNLATLSEQPDVLGAPNCARLRRLGAHWQSRADRCASGQAAPAGGRGWLMTALARLVAFAR